METNKRVRTRYVPSLHAYALASLITDTTSCTELQWLMDQCNKRKHAILLARCRELIPNLVDVSVAPYGQDEACYTFADSRFAFYRPFGQPDRGLLVRSFADDGPEWFAPGANLRRWLAREGADALPCPISMDMHMRILEVIR